MHERMPHPVPPPVQRQYLSSSQVSSLTGFALTTLSVWRRTGKGPAFIRVSRKVLYDRRDVDSWLDAHRCGGEVAR
jgi:predicted DNA-binding transcriptional regulator AlpA